jgi:hypothetical protein
VGIAVERIQRLAVRHGENRVRQKSQRLPLRVRAAGQAAFAADTRRGAAPLERPAATTVSPLTCSATRSAQFMAVNVDRAVSPCRASGNMAVWLSSEKGNGIAHEH